MTNIMVDLETVGTAVDTMILTIAAVEFNHESGAIIDTFYSKIDIDSYKPYTGCFTLDGSTLTWWMTVAPEAARKEAFGGERKPIKTVLENFAAWLKPKGDIRPWSHGSCFDISILSHSLRILQLPELWRFWNIRDTRTLYDVAGVNLKTLPLTEAAKAYPEHHALGDCLRQIEGVRKSYEMLHTMMFPEIEIPDVTSKKRQRKLHIY